MTEPVSATGRPATARASRRRHLALVFPSLPTDRLTRCGAPPEGSRADPDAPFAVVATSRGAIILAACNAAALKLGLRPGLPLADARARLPDLGVFAHDPEADRRRLERIADLCERYSPMVALDPPDGVVLDITGIPHLFGGERRMAADAAARLTALGLDVRHAVAGSPEAAAALARFGWPPGADEADAIRRLPVAALRLEPEADLALRRAGLRTVGDLATRPSAPLAARFGEEAAARLARLVGAADSRIVPRRPPPALLAQRGFAEPVLSVAAALGAIAELATEAAAALERRGAGGRRFAAKLFRCDGQVRDLVVETGRPMRDPKVLARLFGERIEALSDPLDPGFGFDLIRLAVPVVEPLSPHQPRLDAGSFAEDDVSALVDRLSTRLGRAAIRRFVPCDTHRPERAAVALPALDSAGPAAWPLPEAGEPPLRPLHLFDPPQAIEVLAEVPDGPPHRFRWRGAFHDVTGHEGPERIAPEWWSQDGAATLTRDYYRVQDAEGRRFWIFRHGLYGTERSHPLWYMHGLFA